MKRQLLLAAFTGAAACALQDWPGIFLPGLDHPAIEYHKRAPHDSVFALNARILEGNAKLEFQGPSGYLRSTLAALNIPVESQIVVFSKTSLQRAIITPTNPRAIYFNDSVAVAWVRGEPFVEVAAQAPEQGMIFYTLRQDRAASPFFLRGDDCLTCHETYSTLGIPGALLRSVFPAPDGMPVRPLGDFDPDFRSPFHQRWGGWYVTGKTGALDHLGNRTYTGRADSQKPSPELASLKDKFDTRAYLSPYSDVVALLVFEHQMRLLNLFTRAAWETRVAESDKTATLPLPDAASQIADYLLFIGETPFPHALRGASGFTEKFAAQGPVDSHGRSLRQFDLDRRLMRYPCSYLVYSPAFDALPPKLKEAIYRRLWQILSGGDTGSKYAQLSLATRRAIVEILRDTRSGLPEYFRSVAR